MAKQTSLLGELPKRVEKARARAEKIVGSAWKQTLDALPARPRKAVKDVAAQLERATTDFRRRRERALKEVTGALKEARARRRNLVATFEKRAAAAVKPLVARLDVASRADVDRLARRISQLERRMHVKPVKESVAA
jgi:F0F1-type ATP synthase membrane subunit b/b'